LAISNGASAGFSAVTIPQLQDPKSGFDLSSEEISWFGESLTVVYYYFTEKPLAYFCQESIPPTFYEELIGTQKLHFTSNLLVPKNYILRGERIEYAKTKSRK